MGTGEITSAIYRSYRTYTLVAQLTEDGGGGGAALMAEWSKT